MPLVMQVDFVCLCLLNLTMRDGMCLRFACDIA